MDIIVTALISQGILIPTFLTTLVRLAIKQLCQEQVSNTLANGVKIKQIFFSRIGNCIFKKVQLL